MRREHTLKVCANHVVSDQLKLQPMPGSEKAITYYTSDHSGINNVGEDTGEVVTELFAFRFKTPTECQEWTDALEKCKRHDLGSFERVSAMDLSQRPARKEEADVLAEDGQDTVGDAVPHDIPVAAQFDVDLPRMSPQPFFPVACLVSVSISCLFELINLCLVARALAVPCRACAGGHALSLSAFVWHVWHVWHVWPVWHRLEPASV